MIVTTILDVKTIKFYLATEEALHLFKIACPLPKLLCQISSKLTQWIFTNFINVFSQCRCYLPLQKGMTLQLNKLEAIDSLWNFLLKFVLKLLFCIFKLFTSLSRKAMLPAIQTNHYLLLVLRWYHLGGFLSQPLVDSFVQKQ